MKLKTKVLVIGGGPAGSTAARILAGSGIDVILLERNLAFVKPCGGGLSLCAFEEFSIPKSAIKKEVKAIRLVSPSGKKLDIHLRGGSLAIVKRGEFDRELRKLSEEQGAIITEGEFCRISRDEPYTVEAKAGNRKYEIISEYIIAADGVNSRVRTSLGIKPLISFNTVTAIIEGTHVDICEFWFSSKHAPLSYSWVFPATDGISVGTGSFGQGTISSFERFLERRGIRPAGKKRLYRMPVWQGNLYNKDKVIFAGDSAGQVLPLTYEGIYYAMKSGEFAARAIIEGKVDNYKKMWKARFQKRFTLMGKLRDYFLKDDLSAEKLVAIHKKPEVQDISMRLWLMKDSSRSSLASYVKLFGKFLR